MGSSESRYNEQETQFPQTSTPSPLPASPESHVYFGRVETITSMHTAIVCIAHQNFIPLTWGEDWCAPGVCLERVLLFSTKLRASSDETENGHEKAMKEVLNIGEPLRVLLQSSNYPDRCYKWIARCCLKVDEQENVVCTTPIHLLEGHLLGTVIYVNSQYGIIKFRTYMGTDEKAVFNQGSLIVKRDDNANNSIPLNDVVKLGTVVFLVVSKWTSVGINSPFEVAMLEENVNFKAVQVWTKFSNDYVESLPLVIRHHDRDTANVAETGTLSSSACTNNADDNIPGCLISFDNKWGLIQIGNDAVPFDKCLALLYGLKIEGIPLQEIFFPGQIFKMFFKNKKIIKLEYGSCQSGEARKTAIRLYCVKKSLPNDIRNKLEDLNQRQSLWED